VDEFLDVLSITPLRIGKSHLEHLVEQYKVLPRISQRRFYLLAADQALVQRLKLRRVRVLVRG
jgi:hypothetical protein